MLTPQNGPGVRTRVLLLVSLLLIVAGSTVSSLFIVRNRLQKHVQETLSHDLQHSVETFQDLEERRRSSLERENRLLASLPSLKALMTTSDPRTIGDGAEEFWKIGGTELFALADPEGHILAAKAPDLAEAEGLKLALPVAVANSSRHYLLSGPRIYVVSVRPLYFGSSERGTLLGFVISGYPVDHQLLLEIGRGAGAQAAFVSGDRILVSSLAPEIQGALRTQTGAVPPGQQTVVKLNDERFLTMDRDLSQEAEVPLRLVVLKSFNEADRAERDIDRLLFLASLLALTAGSGLMMLLARMVTEPLEHLAYGVRAFGQGDAAYSLPLGGTQEVRYLSRIFARMRDENQKTGRALLEAERLATIGRMASSVSHDLRHYLTAIYANAEFLSSVTLPAAERAELFEDIRRAVNGTTDMLDSLLIFGRTGTALRCVQISLTAIVERAVTLVHSHPDAEGVTVSFEALGIADTTALLDAGQMERAVYNLLLNACHSARQNESRREVNVTVTADLASLTVLIADSGPGVPDDIRDSLFDPFVSRGKQKGTGLGLTLASTVAREHGGKVELVHSDASGSLFRLTAARQGPTPTHAAPDSQGTLIAS